MQVRTVYRMALVHCVLLPLLWACDDAARGPFDDAAELDEDLRQLEAATKYLKVHADNPNSRFGKLAKARAEILLLELGAQYLQAKQWTELDVTAEHLLKLEPSSMAGNLYKSYAVYGQGKQAEAAEFLKKAKGTPRGVTPPTKDAIEATAKALFDGAELGARAALDGSIVDASFLKNARTRLTNTIAREHYATERRAELFKQGTLDAMETLLDNYSESEEAAEVRSVYAEKMAAKLRSVEKVGPPTVEDPDPIATVVDALSRRAPAEKVTKAALAKVENLREAWESRYEEELETIDEQVAEHQAKAMDTIATIIREKCAPLRARLNKGDEAALPLLTAAREEAAKRVPNGLTPEDLQEVSLYIVANCTPSKQSQ